MSQPWFPFYVGDYVRDTARLTTEGHGAYLLLMLDYWANGAPPDDDETLSSIARLSLDAWLRLRQKLAPFFQIADGKWTHKRIEKEREIAKEKHEKRVNAGKAGGEAKAKNKQSSSNASPELPALPYQSQPQPQPQKLDGGGDARAPARDPKQIDLEEAIAAAPPAKPKSLISEDAFRIAGDVLEAMGLHRDDPRSVGAPMTVQTWLNGGWPSDVILVGVQRAMANRKGDPPGTLKYFEKAIARQHAEMSRPLPVAQISQPETFKVNANGKPKSAIIQAADDLCRTIAGFDGPSRTVDELRGVAGEASPRLLSHG